jgi:hypothetical protein
MDDTRRVKIGEPATYVYCTVRAARRPALKRGLRGLPAAEPPRLLDAGEQLWLVVATVPVAQYGAAPIERRLQDLDWVSRCAMTHEAVVEDAGRSGPVVPMKLFTMFSSDERALAHIVRARKRLARLFELVAGREEWGVRVSVDERLAARRRAEGARPAKMASGTGFLLRKKAEKDAARLAIEEALGEAERIFSELAGSAVDARRRTPVQSTTAIRVVLDAAFLVPEKQARTFRKAVAAQAKSRRGDAYDISLTGPWPPYNFVSEPA